MCVECKHFARLTENEREYLGERYIDLSLDFQNVLGFCLRKERKSHNLFFQKIVTNDTKFICYAFSKGSYCEPLKIQTKLNSYFQFYVSRESIGDENQIRIQAMDQGEIIATINSLVLEQKCRYCGSSLKLSGGSILEIGCETCERKVAIPVTLSIWPVLYTFSSQCVHGAEFNQCNTCQLSIRERKSLLDIELPQLVEIELPALPAYLALELSLGDYDQEYWAEMNAFEVDSVENESLYVSNYEEYFEDVFEEYSEYMSERGETQDSPWKPSICPYDFRENFERQFD